MNAMVMIDVGEISLRRQNFIEAKNNEVLHVNLDIIEQVRKDAIIMMKACEQRMGWHFNSKLTLRQFKEEDIVQRAQVEAQKDSPERKLVVNWEGPFRV